MKFYKYLGLRVLTWALTILIGVTFIFFIPRMFPSDPVESMIGQMQARSGDMDPAAKEALRTSLRITIPLVKPAILSGFMLSFGQSIAMYGVPRMLNINILTTAIRESMVFMDWEMSAVLSVVVTGFSLLAVMLYRLTIRSGRKRPWGTSGPPWTP